MGNIKHLIITRFSNKVFPKNSKTNLLSLDNLKHRLNLFKKYPIKTLENQSNKNFTHLVLVHEEIPIEIENELNKLNVVILKNTTGINRVIDYIENNVIDKGFDYLITSRLDDDDCLYYNAIDDIQKSITDKTIVKLFGFKNGCTLDHVKGDFKEFNDGRNTGAIAIGLSLILNLKYFKGNEITVHCGNHTIIRDTLHKRIKKEYNINVDYNSIDFWEHKQTKFPSFIYVRHNKSDSYRGRVLHITNKDVNKDVIKKYFNI